MTLILATGREIVMSCITQTQAYFAASLCTKCRSINQWMIEEHTRKVARELGTPPVLIEPVAKPRPIPAIWNHKGRMNDPLEELPTHCCYGQFSSKPVRNESADGSSLVLLWFQDEWAMPIDSAVIEQIKQIDWEALAKNWHYPT